MRPLLRSPRLLAPAARRAPRALLLSPAMLGTTAGCKQHDDAPPTGGHGVHFRNSPNVHPLGVEKRLIETLTAKGEWVNPTHNHVWSDAEIADRLATQPRHQPQDLADRLCLGFLRSCYAIFNTVTRYQAKNPTPDAVAFRLIFLESVAGVPGMVAAQHRHFRSLRHLSRDYGWIHTLLEEAENERMHLLTFLQASRPARAARAPRA